jgi:hypothetical protein
VTGDKKKSKGASDEKRVGGQKGKGIRGVGQMVRRGMVSVMSREREEYTRGMRQ